MLSAITIGILQMNTEEIQLMRNQIFAAKAHAIAEAGLNDAFSELRVDSSWNSGFDNKVFQVDRRLWEFSNRAREEGLAELITGRCLVCGELSCGEIDYIAEHSEQDIVFATPSQAVRRPACLAELAWRRFERGESDDLATLSPVYIHPQLS